MTTRPVKLGSLAPGVNNVLEPTQLAITTPDGKKSGTFLYGADNVDINKKGYLKRRRGTTNAIAGAAHSLWSDDKGAFSVVNDVLVALTPNGAGLASKPVRNGLARLPVSYSRGADGDVYWSNGADIRRVTAAGADRPVCAPLPSLVPTIAVVPGALAAGTYLIAFTVVDSIDGESPATAVQAITVPANGGLSITAAMPVEVFMSSANGDVLTHQAGGTGTFGVLTHHDAGRRCPTLNTATMPPGSIVRHYNGCMLVASGSLLIVSLPYNYGVRDPSKGYIPFPEPITVVEPTSKGVYVCADKTYWIADLLAQDALEVVLPYGGIAGSSGRSPANKTVFWQSAQGLIVADENMVAKAVQDTALNFSDAASGASLYRVRDGSTHIVTSRVGAQPNVAAATTFMDAEVIRKGTVL